MLVILMQVFLVQFEVLKTSLLKTRVFWDVINPLNAKLNPICHLLALLGARHILHVSRIRVNSQCFEES